MQNRCPFAYWRPLGNPNDEPSIGIPRILIFHTMSGYLDGTDSFFRQNGYGGTESHFGVGGQYDGAKDGTIYQWQLLDRQADAQYSGNAYATSVETSDGAKDNVSWGPKQIDALVDLAVWWCQTTGNPARLVRSVEEHGFGYHSQFHEWDRESHNCPGSPRVQQLKEIIIPRVNAILEGNDMPTPEALWNWDGIPAPPNKAAEGNKNWTPASFLHWGYEQGTDTNKRLVKMEQDVAALKTAMLELLNRVPKPPSDPGPSNPNA